ncbi:hypothetical protein V8324_20315, partial [Roseovarius sp. D22-M7]
MRASGYASESAALCTCVEKDVAPLLDGPARETAIDDFRPSSEAWFHGGSDAATWAGCAFRHIRSRVPTTYDQPFRRIRSPRDDAVGR